MSIIDESTDQVIPFLCGCRVVFLGHTFRRTERMDPCNLHSTDRWAVWRITKQNEARRLLAREKMQRQAR
jgi:hypothetical protein